jgi:hypothetical protein
LGILFLLYQLPVYRSWLPSPDFSHLLHIDVLYLYELKTQIKFVCEREIVICLGMKNLKFLSELNTKIKYFENIITQVHPPFYNAVQIKEERFLYSAI